jgi:aflatoxin B1 aldehyde reductase
LEEQAATFTALHRLGAFEALGVSNWRAETLEAYLHVAEKIGAIKPVIFQVQYNVLCRTAESRILPLLRSHGIAVAAYSPMAGGVLTGKLTFADANDPDALKGTRFYGDNYFGKRYRTWYDRPGMHAAVRRLDELCREHGIAMSDASIRWVAFHSNLGNEDVIVFGASKLAHIETTVSAIASGPLPKELAERMEEVWEICRNDSEGLAYC